MSTNGGSRWIKYNYEESGQLHIGNLWNRFSFFWILVIIALIVFQHLFYHLSFSKFQVSCFYHFLIMCLSFCFHCFIISFFIDHHFLLPVVQKKQKWKIAIFLGFFFSFFHFFFTFHHFCFQWCKNLPKNGKLQFSPIFASVLSCFFIFFYQ